MTQGYWSVYANKEVLNVMVRKGTKHTDVSSCDLGSYTRVSTYDMTYTDEYL